jgi:DUF1680 family protein
MFYYPLWTALHMTFSTPTYSFWCCIGTGVEEFGKFSDTIYFHDDDSVYVNLFIASELDWPEKGLKLRQETDFPRQQGTKLTITAPKPSDVAIRIRIPYWTRGGSVKINGRPLAAFASPGSYLALRGPWKSGDTIELSLPMGLHQSVMPDDETVQAPMYGPLVLAAKHEQAPRERWYGNTGPFERRGADAPPPQMPETSGKLDDSSTWIEPDGQEPLTFRTTGKRAAATLVPIHQIVHERYDVYWKVASSSPVPRFRG